MGRFLGGCVSCKDVLASDDLHRNGADFAEDCQRNIKTFLRIKQLIDARYADIVISLGMDMGSGSGAISIDSNRILHRSTEVCPFNCDVKSQKSKNRVCF
jgi:hypothetical protein